MKQPNIIDDDHTCGQYEVHVDHVSVDRMFAPVPPRDHQCLVVSSAGHRNMKRNLWFADHVYHSVGDDLAK